MRFDLFPCISTQEDIVKWNAFLDLVRAEYKNHPSYREDHNIISIEVTACSKAAEEHIMTVRRLAKIVFGRRARVWSEYDRDSGAIYSWTEVHDQYKLAMDKFKTTHE